MNDCFVIMPCSKTSELHTEEYWANFFEHYLAPSLRAVGFQAWRALEPGSSTWSIMQDLAYTDYVLAVLTDDSPKVFWQLGVRQALNFGTILTLERGQKTFLNTGDPRVLFYDDREVTSFVRELRTYMDKSAADDRTTLRDIPQCYDSSVSQCLRVEANIAANRAVGALRKATKLIRVSCSSMGIEAALKTIRDYDQTLPGDLQLSLLGASRILYHRILPLTSDPFQGWRDVTIRGKSLIDIMRGERSGLCLWPIREHFNTMNAIGFDIVDNGMSAIAFETLEDLEWLVVAEGRYVRVGHLYGA